MIQIYNAATGIIHLCGSGFILIFTISSKWHFDAAQFPSKWSHEDSLVVIYVQEMLMSENIVFYGILSTLLFVAPTYILQEEIRYI